MEGETSKVYHPAPSLWRTGFHPTVDLNNGCSLVSFLAQMVFAKANPFLMVRSLFYKGENRV